MKSQRKMGRHTIEMNVIYLFQIQVIMIIALKSEQLTTQQISKFE